MKQDPGDLNNVLINPCRVPGDTTCANKTGMHSFLGASTPYDLDQDVIALFGEAQFQLNEDLSVQAGVRYENYGSDKTTFDPKISVQYFITPELSLRGSVQTTFRGPSPNDTDPGSATALAYVGATLAFKAIDTTGNPDIEPESAFTYNYGLVYSGENLTASIDYWAFEFENPIIVESYNQLAVAYATGGAAKAAVQDQITCQGGVRDGSCAASGIERIQANVVNGPRVETAGIDFYVDYGMDLAGNPLNVGMEGTYNLKYDVSAYYLGGVIVAPAYEAAGYYNFDNGSRPIQDLKMRAKANLGFMDNYNALLFVNYVSDYEDRRAGVIPVNGDTIDSHVTYDLHVSGNFLDESLSVTASVINISDEEPPLAYGDLMYDAYTHNPLGRMFKVGFRYSFQ